MPRPLDPRPLYLKFRVRCLVRLSRDELLKELRKVARTGYSSGKIEIRWLDWQKGNEGRINEGRIEDEAVLDELRLFYGALTKGSNVRVEAAEAPAPTRKELRSQQRGFAKDIKRLVGKVDRLAKSVEGRSGQSKRSRRK